MNEAQHIPREWPNRLTEQLVGEILHAQAAGLLGSEPKGAREVGYLVRLAQVATYMAEALFFMDDSVQIPDGHWETRGARSPKGPIGPQRQALLHNSIAQLLKDGETTDGVDCVPVPARVYLKEVAAHLRANLTAIDIDPSPFGVYPGRKSRGG